METTTEKAGELTVELTLPAPELAAAVDRRLDAWREEGFARRLWERDPRLWAPGPEGAPLPPELADRLGWLGLPERALEEAPDLAELAERVRQEGYERVVLMGMGGSSLAPEVFQAVLGGGIGYPHLVLLDSTHPAAVRAVRQDLDPAHTLFVVASKSGTTAETLSIFHYLWSEAAAILGAPGMGFVAVTDPGTPLAELAGERGFRHVFLAPPDVGGRYSALSVFGLVPAALVGLDTARLAGGARDLAEGRLRLPAGDNPGLRLAAVLAEAAAAGRDKVTFLAAPPLASLPVWIEQLVAESTGKDGRGLVPVVDEPVLGAGDYGTDRLFVRLALEGDEDAALDETADALAAAGHPVVQVTLAERWDLGAAMLLWEVATAAAGAALGIQPFDQPDVELAKRRAREAMEGAASGRGTGAVDEVADDDEARLREALAGWLEAALPGPPDGDGAGAGRYLAIQAFLAPGAEIDHALRELRLLAADRLGIATTAGYGPRFLHSTGQLHKGGPDTGLFLQLVDPADDDLPIPGSDHGFGDLVRAQAVGDYRALVERGRPVLRVRLGHDRFTGLARLRSAFASVLEEVA